jgi:hypothetical protein
MNWQDYVALTLCFTAACIVAWRAYCGMLGRGKVGCGTGCGSCGAGHAAGNKPTELLTIDAGPR